MKQSNRYSKSCQRRKQDDRSGNIEQRDIRGGEVWQRGLLGVG